MEVDWFDLAEDRKKTAGFCKRGNELSGSRKREEVLAEELSVSLKGLWCINVPVYGVCLKARRVHFVTVSSTYTPRNKGMSSKRIAQRH